MLSPYQPQRTLKIYRLTDGLEHYHREEGIFEVRFGNLEVRQFKGLLGACIFYMTLKEPASVYDVTNEEVLIERKIKIELQ